MKTSSAKQKGRLLQQLMRDKIYDYYPDLSDGDVRSTSMGASGNDVLLSPRARRGFDYNIECKSVAAFVGYKYLDQASQGGGSSGKGVPIAVVKANRRKPVVIIDLEDFMELNRRANNE